MPDAKIIHLAPRKAYVNYISGAGPVGGTTPNSLSIIVVAGDDPEKIFLNFIEAGQSGPSVTIAISRDAALQLAHGILEFVP